MLQRLSYFLFFKLLGWKAEVSVPQRKKCILCVAPHTSNWDFLLGELFYTAIGRKAYFLMKKEWFFPPLGYLFRALGGIPVQRSKTQSLTDHLAQQSIDSDYFNLAVTPEGTRSRVETWKRGFYYIALKAQIPIQLYAIDAKNKKVVCNQEIFPTGNEAEDMQRIFTYYRKFEGLAFHPQKFVVEVITNTTTPQE